MKLLLFLIFMVFSISTSQKKYIPNDIFKIIIDFTDSLKTIETLNRINHNLYKLTSPLIYTYQRFNQEGIIYTIAGKKKFPDTKIENDIIIRYKNVGLERPLIIYTLCPSIQMDNVQTRIDDPLSYRSISEQEKSNHNGTLKKLFPVSIYKSHYQNPRNIKYIEINFPNLLHHITYIKSQANLCQQLFIRVDLSQTDHWFGMEKLFRIIPNLLEDKKIKIKFNNINGVFFTSLKRADAESNNYVVDYIIKRLKYIEFSIDKIDRMLIDFLINCDKNEKEKYFQILCAAKNITVVETNFLSKLDTVKYITTNFSLTPIKSLYAIRSHHFSKFKNSTNKFFNAIQEFSGEEQKLFNKIFNCDLQQKSKKLKSHMRFVLFCQCMFIITSIGIILKILSAFKKLSAYQKNNFFIIATISIIISIIHIRKN